MVSEEERDRDRGFEQAAGDVGFSGTSTSSQEGMQETCRTPGGSETPQAKMPKQADIKIEKDSCGREIVWVWEKNERYTVYRWKAVWHYERVSKVARWLGREWSQQGSQGHWTSTKFGVGVNFTGNMDESHRQAYSRLEPELSHTLALQRGWLGSGFSVDRAIAQAMIRTLEGEADAGLKILAHTVERLNSRSSIEGRLHYLFGVLLGTIIISAFIAILWAYSYRLEANEGAVAKLVAEVAWAGTLGAFMSICLRINQLEIHPGMPALQHVVSAITRLMLGVGGAVILLLVVCSGMAFGTFFGNEAPPGPQTFNERPAYLAAMLLIAVVAGFSEGFVPNVLDRVSGETNNRANVAS